MQNKALLSESENLLLKKHNINKMPEVRVQRLSAAKSARLSSEMALTEITSTVGFIEQSEKTVKRPKSKDALKAPKASLKKSSLSPQKSKSPSRVRAKSKSPARSPSRSRKDPKKTRRTASPSAEKKSAPRGAKLYTKKDLVQETKVTKVEETTLTEITQPTKRVLRSSSSMSSKSDLKSVMKVDLIKNNESINESEPKLNESSTKKLEVCSVNCDEVLFDLGYLKFTRRHVMSIIMVTFMLMLVLSMVNYYDNNREVYQKKFDFYVNSLKNGCTFTKRWMAKITSKIFKSSP
jgi:hypothetical protein